jgi:FKBP-type peptidyl-prolyl cis-trans isomerase 2
MNCGITGGFMHTLRSATPYRLSGVLIGAIMLSLLVVPLVFTTEPSGGPRLSSSQIIPMLASEGSAQEDMDRNPSVAEGAIVFMEYTITIPESDLTIPHNLTLFEQGHQDLLPNIEQALTGMKKGEEKRIDLSSDEAFGPYDESKRVKVSKDHLPADAQPGMIFVTEEGIPFVVIDLIGPMAELDFNHPLAGRHVLIDVRILHVEIPSS